MSVDAVVQDTWLSTQNLRDQVQRALEAALISGDLVPGVVYSAPALAERFGVSATPVREAMMALVRHGQVEVVRNKGFRVTEISDADLDRVAAVRALVEVPVIADVAAHLDRLDVDHLGRVARAIEDAARGGDLLTYLDLDRQFHLTLIDAIGNPLLTEIVHDLRRRTRLFGLERLVADNALVASAREHRDLLSLLCSGRGAEAVDLMRVHITHTRNEWAAPASSRVPLATERRSSSRRRS